MGIPAPRTPRRPARGFGRPLRRLLLRFLDTRRIRWLSPLLWVPAAALLVSWIAAFRHGFGVAAFTWSNHELYVLDSDGSPLRDSTAVPESSWAIETAATVRVAPLRWSITLVTTPTLRWTTGPTDPALPAALVRQVARDAIPRRLEGSQLRTRVRIPAEAWAQRAYDEMLESGQEHLARRPPPGLIAQYTIATSSQYACTAGVCVSLLHWFLRGAQIGYHTRALRRHEAGRCPHCNYDISAAPDHPCPECGTDHRAARREAIDALRRAKRWPLEGPVPAAP